MALLFKNCINVPRWNSMDWYTVSITRTKNLFQKGSRRFCSGINLQHYVQSTEWVFLFWRNAERIFIEDFHVIMQKLRPRPTSHHIRSKLFFHKDLYNCSHVFLRIEDNSVHRTNRTLDRKVLKYISDNVFAIKVNSRCITVDRLKPTYLIIQDLETTPSSTNILMQCEPKIYLGPAKRKTVRFKD